MNDKKKNPLEGIFAQVTDDDLLRENGLLYAENKQLQSNWNSLREYYKRKAEETKNSTALYDKWTKYSSVVDKMNDLEGSDNNGRIFNK